MSVLRAKKCLLRHKIKRKNSAATEQDSTGGVQAFVNQEFQ